MSEAKFVLKEPKSKAETLIYLFYRFDNQTLKYSTAQKIKVRDWNAEKQRAKETKTFPESGSLNLLLDNIERYVKEGHRDLVNNKKIPTPSKLREILKKELFKGEYSQQKTFLSFIKELIENSNRKKNTKKQWGQTLRKLEEYKRGSQKELDFDSIDQDFYNDFIKQLEKEGYAKNTIGGFIKNVKIFMNEAVDRKLTSNLEYRNRKFKIVEEFVEKISLNELELKTIYNLDLSGNCRLEKVRDLFIIACYTGLRFFDLIQIRPDNMTKGGTQIKIRTEKTGTIVIIPVHPYVKAILQKYESHLPTIISNQKMNEYLKEIGKLAELDSHVKIAITRGGKTENEVFKKYELLTTHTARRSFATNTYRAKMNPIDIMKFTGHKTEKSFQKYLKISQQENADTLATHPFFN